MIIFQPPSIAALVLLGQQGEEARTILFAGRTALEVRAHAGDLLIGIRSGELQLDVAVELIETLLARQLRSRGPEQERQETIATGLFA